MNIDRFTQDHSAILEAVSHLRSLIQQGIEANAKGIAAALVGMSGKIKLHLAAEDKVLYPALLKSPGGSGASVARQFQSEMGSLAATYAAFADRWLLGSRIAAAPEDFRAEANAVFKALHDRIRRENQELYPLAAAA